MRALIARRFSHSSNATTKARTAKSSRLRGYTLMEMMIVVAITGILASIALPAFQGYIMRGRASEAVSFLGGIALRQAAYRAEFGGYAGSVTTMAAAAWVPEEGDDMVDSLLIGWPADSGDFNALGAVPDSRSVRFGYAMCAGTPAQASGYIDGAPYAVPVAQLDFYFIAQAQADFDADGNIMTFEIASFAPNIWMSSDKGWE
jgi:prepilin-type N-terminal cleavage/methylation domain-containing protein